MALSIILNGRDLSTYARLAHDEGLDPVDADHIEPQFAGSLAFQEGQQFVRDAAGNREMVIPLILRATNTMFSASFESNADGFVAGSSSYYLNITTSATKVASGSAYKGGGVLEVVCPATIQTGAMRTLTGPFRAGVTYTIEAWLRQTAGGAPAANVFFGAAAPDPGYNVSGSALTSSWQKYTATWTPSADRAEAYFGAKIWAATACTFQMDAVQVYETAPGTDALHTLVRDIDNDLFPCAQLQLKMDAATNATFHELARGRLEPQFQYWVARNNRVRAVLRLWLKPYGSTGTARLVASLTGTGPQAFAATNIDGDVDALANLEVRVGSNLASSGRLIAYGVHPHPSYQPLHPGPSLSDQMAGATVRGGSGAVGSQYLALPVSPTAASGVAARDYLTPADAHIGRHRVLGIVRSGLYPANALKLYALDRFGAVLGPTVMATQNDPAKWQVVDLGEVQVPAMATGAQNVPTQFVELYGGGASGASVLASPALMVNELVYVPLDRSAGLLRTAGLGGGSLVMWDSFERLGVGNVLNDEPVSDSGHTWRQAAAGYIGGYYYGEVILPVEGLFWTILSATPARYSLATGAQLSDVRVRANVGLPASVVASGAIHDFYAKMQNASVGVYARLVYGPSPRVEARYNTGGGDTLLASAPLGAAASGLYGGQWLYVETVIQGPTVTVAVGSQGGLSAPQLVANNAAMGLVGNPGLRMQNGGIATSPPFVNDFFVYSSGGSAPDIQARDWFRFESVPRSRAIRANASLYQSDVIAAFRGQPPRLPPMGSGGASGPARVVVVSGGLDNFLGNDVVDVRIDATERFQYFR